MKRLLPFDIQGPDISIGSSSTFRRFSRRLRDREQPGQVHNPGSADDLGALDSKSSEDTIPEDSTGN